MEVNILIDGLTDCLVDRCDGTKVATVYRLRKKQMRAEDCKDWKFDWAATEKKGYHIYELFVKDNDIVQGRISLKIDGGVAEVDIVEAAPHNFSHRGKYQGVGGHLFAIACQISMEAGCDGVVAFTSKTNLMDYYARTLNAKAAGGQRMYINEVAAQILLDKYIRK